ncbi:MAG: hypothetical protein ACRENP_11500 [Longimicrobiales bacterium]
MSINPGRLLARWPFLTIGLVTFALFLLAESLPGFQTTLAPVLRILIVPLWLMRTLEMVVGMGYWPGPVQLVIALPLLFLPYVMADLVLAWLRRHFGS